MVSFSCEVSWQRLDRGVHRGVHRGVQGDRVDANDLVCIGLWRYSDQEEAGPSSQPMSRRFLYVR